MAVVPDDAGMNDVVIQATHLSKVYRLYSKPSYRFRDMFGLLGNKSGAFTEHAALNDVSIDIRRGEKVAIIGRNGAGKSTFLKLVTNVLQPSSGLLTVQAHVHALLQIGTGFHPDFTGRENVYAYLAQLGIGGDEAMAKCAEIVEFAELEEYIDQPVKTYSTGMAVRLMFATATAITPDLLVLDEVLGVGDAYFAQKSYERIRELCEGDGTTVLLVTHDVYSAVRICNRVIWFDSGRVMMDGDGSTVVQAYAESIRLQEEQRLRVKKQAQLTHVHSRPAAPDAAHLLIEIRARDNRPQLSPVYFSDISVLSGEQVITQLPLDRNAFETVSESHLVREGSCWGDATEWHGRTARPMLNYGSPFHKVVGVLTVPRDSFQGTDDLTIALDYWSDLPCELQVQCFVDERAQNLGALPNATGEWTRHTTMYSLNGTGSRSVTVHPSGAQGAGDIIVTGFAMVDRTGTECFTLEHGQPVTFRIDFRVARASLHERAQVFLIISRNNTERICKFMTSELTFNGTSMPEGRVEMHLSKMMLGVGTYSVAVQIAAEGYVQRGMKQFFSVDPDVYHCVDYAMDFSVINSGWIGDMTVFEGDGEWRMSPLTR